MQNAIPPVSAGVFRNHHHVDAALVCWQVLILGLNLIKVVADRLHDGAERRVNCHEPYAGEERFEARAHLTLLFVTKDHADCGEFAILRFEDPAERDRTNC